MKKILLMAMMMIGCMTTAIAQKPAEIKFDKLTHNFGTVEVLCNAEGTIKSLKDGSPAVLVCSFSFTNAGEQPLVVSQALASCGCTVAEYTKTPIQPGEKGEVKVTYNGEAKFAGHVKKSITIRANGAVEMTRLYIEGDMVEVK
jgi:hypothetical protein